MKVKRYPARNCWQVLIPPHLTESGKRQRKYFKSKEDGEAEIRRVALRGPVRKKVQLSADEAASYRVAVNELNGRPSLLLEAARYYRLNVLNVAKQAHLFELVGKFIERQEHEGRAVRTLDDDRQRLNKLCNVFGNIDVATLTEIGLRHYIEQYPPGGNRRSHYKTVHKFIRWAHMSGYLAFDLMARIRPMDRWSINNEILDIEDFRRVLFVTAGLEPVADLDDPKAAEEDKLPTTKYLALLPYYVLGGLAGMRRSELLRDRLSQQIIEWTDILWAKKLILVRDEVAKKTRAQNRLRYIPLEPAAKEWLHRVARKSGPIVDIYQSTHTRLAAELLAKLDIELPENGLRNSYASYALTFRSLGDVAKAAGDLESTIKRFYIQTLEPETGRAWFDIRPSRDSKILSIKTEAA